MKWAYKIVRKVYEPTLEKTLEDLGNKGWELVAVLDSPIGRAKILIFKKPKEINPSER